MDMSNDINDILLANSRKDVNQEKLNEKISQKVANYLCNPASFKNIDFLSELLQAATMKGFLETLGFSSPKGAFFAMSLVLNDFKLNYLTKSRIEDSIDLSFGNILIKDLDHKCQTHSELIHLKEYSQLFISRTMKKTSKGSLNGEEAHYLLNGKIGIVKIILSNTTFNRICTLIFMQMVFGNTCLSNWKQERD